MEVYPENDLVMVIVTGFCGLSITFRKRLLDYYSLTVTMNVLIYLSCITKQVPIRSVSRLMKYI